MVIVEIDDAAVKKMGQSEELKQAMVRAADAVVSEARRLAPRRTGRGAAGIHYETETKQNGDFDIHISYDEEQFYMGFVELGTRNMRPRPFLRPALDVVRRLA